MLLTMSRIVIERRDGHLTLTSEDGAALVHARVFPDRVIFAGQREAEAGPGGDHALAAIARAVAVEAARDGARVLSWERENDLDWNRHLLAAGFEVHRKKVFVERELADLEAPEEEFGHWSLTDLGDREFRSYLDRASEGDVFEDKDDRNPEREFRELIEYAGKALDRDLWRVMLEDGEPVGVVLPQADEECPTEGSLFYIGVLPAHRGKGLGRRLHAASLALLAAAGLEKCLGSSDVRNVAMLRVFAAKGCPVKGTQVYFRVKG
jgi:ribosomal protein S18 acetylase RimI-like enzyme